MCKEDLLVPGRIAVKLILDHDSLTLEASPEVSLFKHYHDVSFIYIEYRKNHKRYQHFHWKLPIIQDKILQPDELGKCISRPLSNG